MPNQRSQGQKLLTVPVDESFFALMDQGVRKGGYASRSDLARWAIAEELQRLGVDLPKSLLAAPQRGISKQQAAKPKQVTTVTPNDSEGESEPVHVSPLTEIGPPKGQLVITEEARLVALEAQLPPGTLEAFADMLGMEVANRGLRSPSSDESAPPTPPKPQPPHVSPAGTKTTRGGQARKSGKT